MVERFNFSVSEIAALFVLNNIVKIFFMPLIGKAINHFGERKLLSVEYVMLVPIFLTYAFSENRYVIVAMYVLDHIVFNFSIALKTFFQKIADPKDIAPSMAVSFTINHIAAVVFPVVGGLLWSLDFKISFFMGIILAVVSLVFTQMIDRDILKEVSR
jgi:MFS family permease